MMVAMVLGLSGLAVVAGCSGSSDSGGSDVTTTTITTTIATLTVPSLATIPESTVPPASQTTGSTPVTTVPLVPGQPCTPGSSPDCISPENDGHYVYLIGGAACMASPIGGPMCADLDGDGNAGYPDAG
jgi:hypothetical protein